MVQVLGAVTALFVSVHTLAPMAWDTGDGLTRERRLSAPPSSRRSQLTQPATPDMRAPIHGRPGRRPSRSDCGPGCPDRSVPLPRGAQSL